MVGSDAEVKPMLSTTTQVIDAKGQMLTPGFIDSHVHFVEGGFNLASVQLRDARTPQEFITRIADFAKTAEPGTWITGGDWDHTYWGGILPEAAWIDSISNGHPIWLQRLDGHMALANTAAMQAAKISAATKDIAGGNMVRKNGKPTGIFKDNAMSLFDGVVAEPSVSFKDKALEAAMEYVAARGVTAVHHMGSWDNIATFKRAHQAGKLNTRIYAAVPLSSWQQLRDTVLKQGRGDEWLKIGGLKGFADGSLGSHTAALLEPFTDLPSDTGLLVTPPNELYQWVSGADKAGLHIMVHAIGDRAIRQQLDIFEKVTKENGDRDRRFRIEHSQHIAPADIKRYGQLQVIASMQPYHTIDDGRWAEKLIGPERIRTTYPFRDLLDTKARIAFGSDWFVAPPTPLEGIYAAVTRRTLDDKNPAGWVPEQKISVEEALHAYTTSAAFAGYAEKQTGNLEAGKLADFVLIDRDLTRIPPEQIREAKIMLTVVGGKVVFDAGKITTPADANE
ncbi:amidohydrolase [Rhodocytophaga rosea]|uniref:Amidohydrolase n=2 Tax=Rhodocytophaga rosea TaxID=2704465 RepID=A0A6C0GUQ4_9BACT|nr:amidohydrolase [Rhodocytophaga rosea]